MAKIKFEGSEEFTPLSAWAYFGYTILFSIPIIGWIMLLVFSFSKKNINRRNYARSYFCIIAVFLLAGASIGGIAYFKGDHGSDIAASISTGFGSISIYTRAALNDVLDAYDNVVKSISIRGYASALNSSIQTRDAVSQIASQTDNDEDEEEMILTRSSAVTTKAPTAKPTATPKAAVSDSTKKPKTTATKKPKATATKKTKPTATPKPKKTSYSLSEGKYIIGEDIEPGSYTITCTKTYGEDLGNAYGALGGFAGAAIGGNEGEAYSNMMGALGGMMQVLGNCQIKVLGDYGDVLKELELATDQSQSITLKEKTALQIEDGTVTLNRK